MSKRKLTEHSSLEEGDGEVARGAEAGLCSGLGHLEQRLGSNGVLRKSYDLTLRPGSVSPSLTSSQMPYKEGPQSSVPPTT